MGEIAYLGPGFVIGYLGQGDPSAAQLRTHRAFPGRTVVYTGDLGYQDEDCYVYLKGRASRVITLDDGTTGGRPRSRARSAPAPMSPTLSPRVSS